MYKQILIGQILWNGKKAGAETYVLKLAEKITLKCPQLKIRIIFFSRAYEIGYFLKNKGIDYIELHCKNGFDLVGMVRFLFEIMTHRYAIIHTHIPTAISLILLKLFPGLKTIYTEHNSILPAGKIHLWLHKISIGVCDKVLFVTNQQKIKYHDLLGVKVKYEATLPIGIDRTEYHNRYDMQSIRKSIGYDNETCIVSYIGRFDALKRIDKLIKSVALLKYRINKVRLLIVGFGDEISMLRNMTVSEDVAHLTDFYISPKNLIDLQRCIDFLVHPSEHESLGLSVLEAMALGKIVIINNFESANEIVKNGNDGIIIDDIYPKAIADTVTALWFDATRRQKISEHAAMTIQTRFDFEDHFKNIIDEYDSLLY
jgi:glycosyltransferase involved in cell wall biosynthesis